MHSCGTVEPHGFAELTHPEHGFFIVGMKSYGRAPTFLLATGYEQVRSVTAWLAGDTAAARNVELVLPATGVCSTDAAASDRRIGERELLRLARHAVAGLRRRAATGGTRGIRCTGCPCVEPPLPHREEQRERERERRERRAHDVEPAEPHAAADAPRR